MKLHRCPRAVEELKNQSGWGAAGHVVLEPYLVDAVALPVSEETHAVRAGGDGFKAVEHVRQRNLLVDVLLNQERLANSERQLRHDAQHPQRHDHPVELFAVTIARELDDAPFRRDQLQCYDRARQIGRTRAVRSRLHRAADTHVRKRRQVGDGVAVLVEIAAQLAVRDARFNGHGLVDFIELKHPIQLAQTDQVPNGGRRCG
jgi:hypothetical protein